MRISSELCHHNPGSVRWGNTVDKGVADERGHGCLIKRAHDCHVRKSPKLMSNESDHSPTGRRCHQGMYAVDLHGWQKREGKLLLRELLTI